jgi:hypothetical protein
MFGDESHAEGFYSAVNHAVNVVAKHSFGERSDESLGEYFAAVDALGDLLVNGGLVLTGEQQLLLAGSCAPWLGTVDGIPCNADLRDLALLSPLERVPYLKAQARADEADYMRHSAAYEYEEADRLRAAVMAEQIASAPKRLRATGVERRLARSRNSAPRDATRRKERKFWLRQDDV